MDKAETSLGTACHAVKSAHLLLGITHGAVNVHALAEDIGVADSSKEVAERWCRG